MSNSPRYTLIGAFVVGACAILVAALLVLGSGKLFSQKRFFVSYFGGSVTGLRVGATVSFRGARIGTVSDVKIVYKKSNDSFLIPVVYEIDTKAIAGLEVNERPIIGPGRNDELLERLIARGLRAQLALESLVTGQLYVQLDFYPDNKPVLIGENENIPEIPTVASPLEKLKEKVEDIPLTEIAQNLRQVLERASDFLQSEKFGGLADSVTELAKESRQLVEHLDSRSGVALNELVTLVKRMDQTLAHADAALQSAEAAFGAASPVTRRVSDTLGDIQEAARAIKRFADYAQQHPEAFVRGKK